MITKGQKINERYQIIRMIGEGGMANVYLANDTILDRYVAVKILRGDLADDEKFVRRFQREAISASALSHPNIVEMYDVGEDDGKYFIVMEYVEGKTLKNLVKRRGALTLPEIIDIMLQLTSGIAVAHDGYIIHRDIKPQNVLILDNGTVKITDFGIAMALGSNELTQTNSVMGSVHYLPPEQANGSGSTLKSDIYSLGILMYELLTGKIPFKGDNAVEIAIKHMKENIPSVIKVNPDIPQSIENIILKACAKNPKNRYDSVLDMHRDLQYALSEEMIDAKRLVYAYPEQDLEETKIMPKISSGAVEGKDVKKLSSDENGEKKTNLILIIVSSVLGGLILLAGLFIILFPKLTAVPDIKIPDVSNMTVASAEKTLKDLGLSVAIELQKMPSNDIEKDMVIETEPKKDRTVKKGTMIAIVVSTGPEGVTVENYVGKNFFEVKGMLESKKIRVETQEKEVTSKDDYKENIILEQKTPVGSQIKTGDTIILVIPKLVTTYPDFVKEGWDVAAIREFCEKYGVILTVEFKETNTDDEGTVLSQSRSADSPVVKDVNLKIVVAKTPVVESVDGDAEDSE